MNWNRKDLLGLEELSKEEILLILDQAKAFQEISLRSVKKVPALRGRTVALCFLEPSTRTRTSFELAAKRLGGDVINMSAEVSTSSQLTTSPAAIQPTLAISMTNGNSLAGFFE